MNSIAYIPASNESGNASLMTIQSVRAPLATTIQVNTVTGVPDKFFGTMGTPHTFTDPVTGETITVISEATAVDFAGHVDSGDIEIDEIAAGFTDNGSQVGDVVILRPTTQWADNLFNTLSTAHNDDGSLKSDSVATSTVQDDAITPDKRSGGFKIGTIAGSTFGTTGNKAITGVGFKPKLVRFTIAPTASNAAAQTGVGAMTASAQFVSCTWSSATPSAGRISATDGCIGWMSSSSSFGMKSSYVSFDNDGFTIKVDTAGGAFDIAYEAYA